MFAIPLRLALLALAALALTATALALAGPRFPDRATGTAPLIVALGGGMTAGGEMELLTAGRAEAAVALWRAGVAPRILFSGGGPNRAAPEAAAMRAYALEAGVPADAIETEERSRSTLQNARFSADRLGGFPDRIVLVTDGFHLPRAWASFRWAGAREIDLVRAPGFDRVGWDGWRYHLQRETLAWWFNLARLGLVTALEAVGVPRSATDPLLA